MGKGKTVIITGGAYGIGRAISQTLALSGWQIVIFDANRERGLDTEQMIQEVGGTCLFIQGDVRNAGDIGKCLEEVEKRFNQVDALVNNAGIRIVGTLFELNEEQWDQLFDINVKGSFLFAKMAVPLMIKAGGGCIINTSSPDAHGRLGSIGYSSSKAAVVTFTKCLAGDLLKHHIRVHCVSPGFTFTGMTEHYSQEKLNELADKNVSGRIGLPADVAGLIQYLLSDQAEALTGGIYDVHNVPTR